MSLHFLNAGSGTTRRQLKMASDTSLCLICVCVWPWGPMWMLQEQGDRVQLLSLNADTHAEAWKNLHTHTHPETHTHSHPHVKSQSRLGQPGSKHLYSWRAFALAPPPTVFHLTVGRGFYFHTQKTLDCVGVCLWLYLWQYGATRLNVFLLVLKGVVFWHSSWPWWHRSSV